jgi:3-oxoacyl-[acyl-carrier protein] reductase
LVGSGEFAGRVALVTGGTRGIGAAITRALAREGACVYAVFLSNADAASSLSRQIGDRLVTLRADIAQPEAAAALVERVVKESGRLDVMVNCAGGAADRLLLRATPDYVRQTLALNLESVIHCSRAALSPMLRQRYGRIVSIGSVVAASGNPGQAVYAAAKAGVEGFTRSLAREVASKGVTANCVAPGWIDTELTSAARDSARTRAISATPVGRAGTPEEVADAVLFLASERAAYVTGTVLQVNGGLYM